MANKMKKIELLAPAKNKDAAIIAINYGADAVYMGADFFGARAKAANSIEDIEEVVLYAHKFGVRVYTTVNTILDDEELERAVELIYKLYEIGVDAIIIQDVGLLGRKIPPLPIFASTQCHNDSLEKIKFLESEGFSRAILARELSLKEIENIAQNSSIELETFIHGALCVSYSGQCYLSYAIGRRSANRGECAQPCRKKYSLLDEKGCFVQKDKYLLSLKDFNASNHLKELVDAGVTSFKIEGRLKDANYVKNIVAYYRQKLDSIIAPEQRASYGVVSIDFEPNPEKSFNRGFTDYLLTGQRNDIHSFNTQKALGEKIGKVTFVSKNYFILDKNILNQSDGICFFAKDELKGTNINKIDGNKIYPQNISGIEKDMAIYRNFDFEFEKQLKNSCCKRKIPVEISVRSNNSDIIFEIKDEIGQKAEVVIENTFENANNEEKMIENLKNQLVKTSESEFVVADIEISLEKTPFIPVSKINEIRRNLLEKFSEERQKSYSREEVIRSEYPQPYFVGEVDYSANVMNKSAKEFYEKRDVVVKEMALETGLSALGKKVMTTKHCILYSLGKCKKETKETGRFFLLDEKGRRYALNFDCKNCRMEIIF